MILKKLFVILRNLIVGVMTKCKTEYKNYLIVETILERDFIKCTQRKPGLLVCVIHDEIPYSFYLLEDGDYCLNSSWVKQEIHLYSIGNGINIFNQIQDKNNAYNFYTLASSDESVKITKNLDGTLNFEVNDSFTNKFITSNNLDISESEKSVNIDLLINNVGEGTKLYNFSNNKKHEIKSLVSDTLKIINTETNEVKIDYNPVVLSSIKTFYVNEDYSGDEDGSIIRPYSTLVKALIAVIGDGTLLYPQYSNANIILQTNVTVSKQDLIDNAILENRISINTITISSNTTENKIITYNGDVEYPISSEFLIEKAKTLSLNNTLGINFYFNYITFHSNKIQGLVKAVTYDADNIYSSGSFLNCSFQSNYLEDHYNSFNPKEYLFGNEIKYAIGIPNINPVLHIKGHNSVGGGNISFTKITTITNTSQTGIKIEDTTINFATLILNTNSSLCSYISENTYNPTINRMEVVNSWIWITDILASYSHDSVKHSDNSWISVKRTSEATIPGDIIINDFYGYSSHTGSLMSFEGDSTSAIHIYNVNTSGIGTSKGAFVNNTSNTYTVDIRSGNLNNVKSLTESNVKVSGNNLVVNNMLYNSSMQTFADEDAAKSSGLLSGHFYLDSNKNVKIL